MVQVVGQGSQTFPVRGCRRWADVDHPAASLNGERAARRPALVALPGWTAEIAEAEMHNRPSSFSGRFSPEKGESTLASPRHPFEPLETTRCVLASPLSPQH